MSAPAIVEIQSCLLIRWALGAELCGVGGEVPPRCRRGIRHKFASLNFHSVQPFDARNESCSWASNDWTEWKFGDANLWRLPEGKQIPPVPLRFELELK